MLPIKETSYYIKKNNVSSESIYKRKVFIIIKCAFYHKSMVYKSTWRIFRISYTTYPGSFRRPLTLEELKKADKAFFHKADKIIVKENEGVNYVFVCRRLGAKEETKMIVFKKDKASVPLKWLEEVLNTIKELVKSFNWYKWN